MTAQNTPHEENLTPDRTGTQPDPASDPIGPIALTKRSRVGARALALVGTASFATLAVNGFLDACITTVTIEQ
jgi:hypothetical protein